MKNDLKKRLLALALLLTVLPAMLCLSGCAAAPANSANSSNSGSLPDGESGGQGTEQNTPGAPDAAQQTGQIFASVEEYPLVDGSTAALPLMAQVLADTCGIPAEEAEVYCAASKTAQSWQKLIGGGADLLLVYEMPESVREYWQSSGVELEMTPIGRDALVFIVNEGNPVESLTQAQLRDIYTGRVTDWAALGGMDEPITAFQRDESSGSQTLFAKLLMQGETPMDAPAALRPGMMGGLIDALAEYDGSAGAIGYSVFYYASEMYQKPGLRFFAVDGVLPSAETIADGSYPLTNEFYAAIRADEPENSAARRLYAWICGAGGRAALDKAGYVPAG